MAQQSTSISTFAVYSAAPEAESFAPVSLDDLREILAELESCDPAAEGTAGDVSDDIDLLTETVIPAAESGVEILVARDEDGYYFARRSAEPQTFALIVPCEERPCPAGSGIAHAHLSDDALCGCGAYVALEGAVSEGDDAPFYRARSANGTWTIRCPECGAEHLFVDAPANVGR